MDIGKFDIRPSLCPQCGHDVTFANKSCKVCNFSLKSFQKKNAVFFVRKPIIKIGSKKKKGTRYDQKAAYWVIGLFLLIGLSFLLK